MPEGDDVTELDLMRWRLQYQPPSKPIETVAMLSEDHKTILRELAIYVTFLAGSVSSLAAPTFCELLLIGGMLSGEGFLIQALLTSHYENVWSSYHHWVSHGSWHCGCLSHRRVLLVASKAPEGQIIFMILDDLTLERCSENAPACRTHYQHSKKKNQCKYILGQCWVYVAIAFQRASDRVYTAVPVMAFPSPKSGNTSKLKIASAMLQSIRQTLSDKAIRLLTDCWFMNWTLMQPALELGYEFVGHIPKNRALYALPIVAFPPSPFKKRGRPRKYGVKMTLDEVEKLPETRMSVWLYGKYRDVSFRSCICRARFLKGRIVRVVWSRFINDKHDKHTVFVQCLFVFVQPCSALFSLVQPCSALFSSTS